MPERAHRIYDALKRKLRCEYDEGGTVGKRYSRLDEIGTPWCVTIDSQTFQDGSVTVRDRDAMTQDRVAEDALERLFSDRISSWTPP